MYEQESMNDMLKENLELARENNRLLKAMRRDAIVGGIIRIALWLLVIVGSYYLTMQYLEPLLGSMTGGEAGQGMDFNALLEQYRSLGE